MMFTGGTHSKKRSISNSQKRHGFSNPERVRAGREAGPSNHREVRHKLYISLYSRLSSKFAN